MAGQKEQREEKKKEKKEKKEEQTREVLGGGRGGAEAGSEKSGRARTGQRAAQAEETGKDRDGVGGEKPAADGSALQRRHSARRIVPMTVPLIPRRRSKGKGRFPHDRR